MAARADTNERLLMLIDSEPIEQSKISAIASRAGWRTVVRDVDAAVAALSTHDAVVSAIVVTHGAESEAPCNLIGKLKRCRPDLAIILLTDDSSPSLAVQAIRAGASDYLVKPVAADKLLQALRLATSGTASKELQPLAAKIHTPVDFDSMIGACPPFRTALAHAARAARGPEHVLVGGESGSGKDMLVRAMHRASRRAKMPLRFVNARSVKANELESLLFGHERGAFPGAFARRIGELELCDGGTLVLDEASRLPTDVQVRLADVIEHGRVRPMGAQYNFPVDVRIFAAVNYTLAEQIGESWIEPGLLKVLSPISINLPPLRERIGDIPTLARFFLARISEQTGLRDLSITEEALSLLATFNWPGNIRQLQAVLFRAAAQSEAGVLSAACFPHLIRSNALQDPRENCAQPSQFGVQIYADDGHVRRLEQIEADVIRLAIGHYRGRMTEVARKLGMGRSTLYRKLQELGIDC